MESDLTSLVGKTPMVELHGFDTGPCRLFLKLENQNPGGSIKDRIAIEMIEDAEARGLLKPGGTIVEATAGNTGLGLALIAAQKGYRLILAIPDKMSREKILHIQALGAEVVLTRSDVPKGHPDFYMDRARAIAESIPGAWLVDQFSNPANPRAHVKTTGPEIWEQMEHDVDAIVVGVGSGGTLTGLSQFFRERQPNLQMVLADPEGSALAHYVQTGAYPEQQGPYVVEGIGGSSAPVIADFSRVARAYSIPDRESLLTAREVLKKTGILVGSSSGTLISAALRYCREQTTPKRVVTFACDGGGKYLSKLYNDLWMVEQGFLSREQFGDLRDLIGRPFADGATVTVAPEEPLAAAYRRMKSNDISQLPVVKDGRAVGILDESDLLFAINEDRGALDRPVEEFMSTQLRTLPPSASVGEALALLKDDFVPIIADENRLYGLITKIDAVEYLRKAH